VFRQPSTHCSSRRCLTPFQLANATDRVFAWAVTTTARAQVAIIGGGPAGLLLSHILHRNGIDSIVLERQNRRHVLDRIRAGVLEAGTVALLREVGLGERMDREGDPHDGSAIVWEDRPRFFIDTMRFTGKRMMAYGQTAITEDLYAARDQVGGRIIDEAGSVRLFELTSKQPFVTCEKDGSAQRIDCDYVAGCDGYHGVSRSAIPGSVLKTYEKSPAPSRFRNRTRSLLSNDKFLDRQKIFTVWVSREFLL